MTNPQSPKSEILEYQKTLQRAGYYLGDLDGDWGPKTQRAHEAYQAAQLPPAPADNSALEAIRKGIIAAAEHFLNLTETVQNSKWDDVATRGPDARAGELRQALLDTGWQLGWAYCAAFAEACWRAGYKARPELALIGKSITPSVMGTLENFEQLHRITRTPSVGAIMMMQHGNTWQGHAGIVTGLENGRVLTIEGNTSSNDPNNREGDGVYRKSHALSFSQSSGLWLRGFVNPFVL